MSMTDPVADMLTRIRNAVGSRHRRVDVPASKMKAEIDFDRVKEMVKKSTPKGAYPPLEGIDRLSNLFGKLDS